MRLFDPYLSLCQSSMLSWRPICFFSFSHSGCLCSRTDSSRKGSSFSQSLLKNHHKHSASFPQRWGNHYALLLLLLFCFSLFLLLLLLLLPSSSCCYFCHHHHVLTFSSIIHLCNVLWTGVLSILRTVKFHIAHCALFGCYSLAHQAFLPIGRFAHVFKTGHPLAGCWRCFSFAILCFRWHCQIWNGLTTTSLCSGSQCKWLRQSMCR